MRRKSKDGCGTPLRPRGSGSHSFFLFFQNLKVNSTQLNGLRERTAELEARMSEKQQLRRQLMQQLELLMSQLNVRRIFVNRGNFRST